MGQPHAAAAHRGLPGKPTGGPENSFTEKQIFYDVAGSIFVAGWSEGFLGGRERSHWVLKAYIFFTIGGDVDCSSGGPVGICTRRGVIGF